MGDPRWPPDPQGGSGSPGGAVAPLELTREWEVTPYRIELANGFTLPAPETTIEAAATLRCRRGRAAILAADPARRLRDRLALSLSQPVRESSVLRLVFAGH
jgi:hypothetical protein